MTKFLQESFSVFMPEGNWAWRYKKMISIIIPIRRGENIMGTILSIHESTYKDYEIIIVNEGLERSEQRNIGIQRAKGKYLLILDSDQHLTPNLLKECYVLLNMNDYDALYIPERVMGKGLFNRVRRWERQFYTATPIDVVRFVRAAGCPDFDVQQKGTEDSDWDRRIQGRKGETFFGFLHYDKVTLLSYLAKKAYYSKSIGRFERRHPGDQVLNFWWRCFGVYFENGKWKRVLRRPDLMLLVWGLVFLRGVVYLWNK